MSKQVNWNKKLVDKFIEEAMLSDDEQKILISRAKGWTRTKQANEYGMSLATVDRIIKRLKVKYDEVQKNTPELPKRRVSEQEIYMDTH